MKQPIACVVVMVVLAGPAVVARKRTARPEDAEKA
jgi:hypothetical protein